MRFVWTYYLFSYDDPFLIFPILIKCHTIYALRHFRDLQINQNYFISFTLLGSLLLSPVASTSLMLIKSIFFSFKSILKAWCKPPSYFTSNNLVAPDWTTCSYSCWIIISSSCCSQILQIADLCSFPVYNLLKAFHSLGIKPNSLSETLRSYKLVLPVPLAHFIPYSSAFLVPSLCWPLSLSHSPASLS